MIYHRKKGWELREHQATDEMVFFNRRQFLKKSGLVGAAIGTSGLIGGMPHLARAERMGDKIGNDIGNVIAADLYPAKRNAVYEVARPLSAERVTSVYNNFYEFGSHKRIAKAAQALKLSPWDIRIEGEVEQARTIGVEDLIRQFGIEERLYRHRCVEAWAMTVPWSGFALSRLVRWARPKSGARYVLFETFMDKDVAFGQRQIWYPWPYTEAVTMAEAMNDLSFMGTGIYGHPLQKQFGAPLRLVLPWKYGFKSIKSIRRIAFVRERPQGFWEKVNGREYGFWANVNPEVPHPRWSQLSEELLGEGRRVPTQLFNGYGEFVGELYSGMDAGGRTLWH